MIEEEDEEEKEEAAELLRVWDMGWAMAEDSRFFGSSLGKADEGAFAEAGLVLGF